MTITHSSEVLGPIAVLRRRLEDESKKISRNRTFNRYSSAPSFYAGEFLASTSPLHCEPLGSGSYSQKCESAIKLLIRANQVISKQNLLIIFERNLVTSKLVDNI